VILCSYNEITDRLADKLKEQGTRYVMIEPREEKQAELNEKKILSIFEDFTSAEVLKEARIDRATAIVFTSESNVDNVVGSIIARKLNPTIKVLNRLGDEAVRKKVYGTGTDMAVIPEHLAGIEMGEYIARTKGV
jgi:Trk K+ transport system NAD-binding subunit